ncbi:LacI family DNA-binding transcriptional regulator [Arthrobacter sp. CJ23]|uniref:LacI family DNA-binding transcriptional regulator n=1 Tax=Arthrobacter sp. CJ23 TaxID=2972479 RepID=UPI00215CC87E|nr:LacI family DNA-binding transcriptional regulator [Arthrobacter sp. CJ23]UVJ39854.1 LacI family transcriptional regulator [Arthrobacter sp. CJ23]
MSRSTVSYALSGARPISPATRERILRAMADLGYTPNLLAQGLAGKRTGIVSLIFPVGEQGMNTTEFEYVQGAAEQARADGYHLLLWPIDAEDVDEVQRVVAQGLVDGVILMEIRSVDKRIPALVQTGVPFTMIGRPKNAEGLTFVDADFEAMGELAVAHLAALGHTEIGLVTHSQESLEAGYGPMVRSWDAVAASASRHRIGVRLFPAVSTLAGGREVFEQILATAPQTTGLVAINEAATIGLLGAASNHGWLVPRDLSVVAINTSEGAAERTMPALTTVSADPRAMGRQAAHFLSRRLRGEDAAVLQALAEPVLAVRSSTAAARTNQP